MQADSSILACKIPWAEEPGRLQSMGSQRATVHGVTKSWAGFSDLTTATTTMQAEEPTVCGGSEWKEKSSEGSGSGRVQLHAGPTLFNCPLSGRFFDLSQGLFPHLQDEKTDLPADGRTELYVMICLIHNP